MKKYIKNTIPKIFISLIITFVILFLLNSKVYADGNPYNPYKPKPTGMDLDVYLIIGFALHFIGLIFIFYSKILQKFIQKK